MLFSLCDKVFERNPPFEQILLARSASVNQSQCESLAESADEFGSEDAQGITSNDDSLGAEMKIEAIREMIGRKDTLSADELSSLKAGIIECAKSLDRDDATIDELGILSELADATDVVVERETAMKAQAEEAESRRLAAREKIAKINGSDENVAGESDASEGDDANADANADAEKVAELVASGKKTYRSGPSRMVSNDKGLTPEIDRPQTHLVATGFARGKNSGEKFTSREDLAIAMGHTLRSLDPQAQNGRVLVASASWVDQFPEERRLRSGADEANLKKLDAVVHPMAITASGGIPQPVNVDYSLDTWATPDRPFRDALVQYQCDRGGLTYRLPPDIGALAAASTVWTNATDTNPAGATKPVYTVAAASPVTTYVNAIPTRLQFGNLMGQFDPETIAANTDLAMVAAARVAEIELLTLLQSACVNTITSAQVLGASRDWFSTIEKVVANYRYTHRLPISQKIVVVLPEYVKGMLRQDKIRELANSSDNLHIPENYFDEALALRNIKVIWTLDALTANAGAGTYVNQQFSGFTASAAVPVWPTAIMWNLFVEGAVQHLDAGMLNLGVVRDATLDSTNDYETFVEIFEGLAFRGFSAGALQVVSTLLPTGASSATATVSVA